MLIIQIYNSMESNKKNKYKMLSQNVFKKKIYKSDSLLEIPEYLLKQKIVTIHWTRKNQNLIQELNSFQNHTTYQCTPLDVGHQIDVAIQYENMNLDRITISFGTISFSNIDQQAQAEAIFKQPILAELQIGSSKIMDSIKALNMQVWLNVINGKLVCKKNSLYQFSMDQLMSMEPNRSKRCCSIKVDNGLKLWGKIFGRNTLLNEQILDCNEVPMSLLFSTEKIWIQFLFLVNQAKNLCLSKKKHSKVSNLLSNISTDQLEDNSKDLKHPKIKLHSQNCSNVNSQRDTVPKPLIKQSSISCLNVSNVPRQSLGNRSQGDKDQSYYSQFEKLIFQDNQLNQIQKLDLNKSFQKLDTPQNKQKEKKINEEIEQREKRKKLQKAEIQQLQNTINQLELQKEKLILQNKNIKKNMQESPSKQSAQKQIVKLQQLKRHMKCDEVKLKAWLCMHRSKQRNQQKKLQRVDSNRNSLPISQKFRKSNTQMTNQMMKVAQKARYNKVKRMISELIVSQPILNHESKLNISYQK